MDKCPKCHAPARCGPPDGDFRYVPPISYRNELTAANKAIVALSEALEYVEADMNDYMPIPSDTISRVTQALTTHADAIKRAKDTK